MKRISSPTGATVSYVQYGSGSPRIIDREALAQLEALAEAGDRDGFAVAFFHGRLSVPLEELNALRASALWQSILDDAQATLGDLRALSRYEFVAERYRDLRVPVLLQIGTESPSGLYVTDALATVLPDVRIEALPGQAHEGMTTAPEMYAAQVCRFLLSGFRGAHVGSEEKRLRYSSTGPTSLA